MIFLQVKPEADFEIEHKRLLGTYALRLIAVKIVAHAWVSIEIQVTDQFEFYTDTQ